MVVLKRFGNYWGPRDLSPFCAKVETYLRMAHIDYRAEIADTRRMPKQKLPVVDDDGELVCDSRDIVQHFEAKLAEPLDAHLSPQQRAVAVAFRALIEEELYFYLLYARWLLDAGWACYAPHLAAYVRAIGVPGFAVPLVLGMVRRSMVASVRGQGSGRHSVDQVEARMREVVTALSTQLDARPFMLGDRPCTLDASAFAAVEALFNSPFPGALRGVSDFARTHENLQAYLARINAEYFPEATG